MPKTNLSDILKNGENFKLKRIDLSNKKVQNRIKGVKYLQSLAERRKYVDWNYLSKFYIKSLS